VLCGAIADLTAGWKRDDLLSKLEARGIPAGPINDIGEVFADPQVVARGLRRALDAGGRSVPAVACPIVIDGERMIAEQPSPALGKDGETILSALKMSAAAKE
jgi:crotonobetainyl-CoA:carnitine CoA-transferase CaiB-like acyl-CoA transferase